MIPTDHACSPKTPLPGELVDYDKVNWMCEDIEIDAKGEDMTTDYVIDVLRGRFDPGYTFSKQI